MPRCARRTGGAFDVRRQQPQRGLRVARSVVVQQASVSEATNVTHGGRPKRMQTCLFDGALATHDERLGRMRLHCTSTHGNKQQAYRDSDLRRIANGGRHTLTRAAMSPTPLALRQQATQNTYLRIKFVNIQLQTKKIVSRFQPMLVRVTISKNKRPF
jgi:hypothetical protein